jgi:hypothetical protein
MAENTFYLEVDVGEYHPTQYRFAFATKDAALAQMAILEPKVGLGKFRNDPDNNRHRIVSDDGEAVLVAEHIRLVRVLDVAAFSALSTYANDLNEAANAKLERRIAEATVIAQRTLAVPVGDGPQIGAPDQA